MKGFRLWHKDLQESELVPIELPEPAEEEMMVKADFSMISIGTERLVVTGGIPEELFETMRVPFMEGNFDFPLSYGYSLVGKVITGPGDWVNRRVHLMHPHQSHLICRPENLWPIQEAVPSKRASLASNLETALNALWDSRLLPGEKVLVIGGGLIGLLIGSILNKMPLEEWKIMESDTSRVRFIRSLDWQEQLLTREKSGAFDLAFHCSGTADGLQTAINSVGKEGRVVELSWYGNRRVELSLGGTFHSGSKRIISSQVGNIPLFMRNAWDYARRKKMVFRLLEDDFYDRIARRSFDFQDAPLLYSKIRKGMVLDPGLILQYSF